MFLYSVLTIISLIVYIKWRHAYWNRCGVVQLDPKFLVGNSGNVLTRKQSLADIVLERYNRIKSLNQKSAGIYLFIMPIYYPIDPAIIKLIMQKDFNYFMGHGLFHHPKDILSMNLFNLEGDVWKQLRSKLTPTFTSGKMKMMFDILVEKTTGLVNLVQRYANSGEPVAIKDILGRFTTDVIGSCAFGIECNCLEYPNSSFGIYGKKAFESRPLTVLMISLFSWELLANIGFKSNGTDVSQFFIKLVKDTIRTREVNKIIRKDFMHLLLQLKDSSNETQQNDHYALSENEIIAQCFVFFLAGYETSSTAMTFALLELAQNAEIQDKLRQEINMVLKKYNGQLTYDALMEMSYLDKVVNETLRKFPPAPVIPRVCTKNYIIPGTDILIEKGRLVHIPVWGLHRDPDYYPDPERFDPERFSEENKSKLKDFTYLPFGGGPRMCIGLRFGLLQTKMGLVSLIKNFRFLLNKKTTIPVELSPGSIIISVKGEVWLNVSQIEENSC